MDVHANSPMVHRKRIAFRRPWCSGNTTASNPVVVGSIPTGRAAPTDRGSEPSISVEPIDRQSLSQSPAGCGGVWPSPPDLGSGDSQVQILPPGPVCWHGIVTGIAPDDTLYYYCWRCRRFALEFGTAPDLGWKDYLFCWLGLQLFVALMIIGT